MSNNANNPLDNDDNAISGDDLHGVQLTTEENSIKRSRKAPRRNGKGANASSNSPNLPHQPRRRTSQLPKAQPTNTPEVKVDGTVTSSAVPDSFGADDFGGEKTLTGQRIIPFMKVAKPFAIISAIITILAVIAIVTKGLNLGLDFTGGVSATVNYAQPVEQSQVQSALHANHFDDSQVQYLGNNKEILVRLPPQDKSDELNAELGKALELPNNHATIKTLDIIGSQVGDEIYLRSVGAMALALLCMFIYVTIRFEKKLAFGAVIALFHDSLITLGIFAIFGWPFDLTVLAAILSLIGYSLNDTIVVFDRIRENFRRVRGLSPTQVVNLSLTETLRRTIMTVSTVLLVVLAMLFLGGPSLFWFAVALLIGLILGTFSSVYIASAIPLWLGMSRKDFIVQVKPEFVEEEVSFHDKNAPKTLEY